MIKFLKKLMKQTVIEETVTLSKHNSGLNCTIIIRKQSDIRHNRAYIDVEIGNEWFPFMVTAMEFPAKSRVRDKISSTMLHDLEKFVEKNRCGLLAVYHQKKHGFVGICDGEFVVNLVSGVDMSTFDFLNEDVSTFDFLK